MESAGAEFSSAFECPAAVAPESPEPDAPSGFDRARRPRPPRPAKSPRRARHDAPAEWADTKSDDYATDLSVFSHAFPAASRRQHGPHSAARGAVGMDAFQAFAATEPCAVELDAATLAEMPRTHVYSIEALLALVGLQRYPVLDQSDAKPVARKGNARGKGAARAKKVQHDGEEGVHDDVEEEGAHNDEEQDHEQDHEGEHEGEA